MFVITNKNHGRPFSQYVGSEYADACSLPKHIFLWYVGFVPESNVLAIFVSDWRCEFLLKFLFVTEKKIVDKFWYAEGVLKHFMVS
jgi:hypothetical protein